MTTDDQNTEVVALTADIVSAYVGNNTVVASDLPSLIDGVCGALAKAAQNATNAPVEDLTPAVPIKRSITPDHIICLEDGKPFKSLKRHLRTKYDLSPEEYREKWNLSYDYPMVAPNYAAARSKLAKKLGLGRRG